MKTFLNPHLFTITFTSHYVVTVHCSKFEYNYQLCAHYTSNNYSRNRQDRVGCIKNNLSNSQLLQREYLHGALPFSPRRVFLQLYIIGQCKL